VQAFPALIGLTLALSFLAGCRKAEERVAPPNEKTAAPARLPGQTEDQKGDKGMGAGN
jgi:hypothetical protein